MKNPPAFPRPSSEFHDANGSGVIPSQEGMTLRDYFAATAMQFCNSDGGLSRAEAAEAIGITAEQYKANDHWHLVVARIAYKYADAMLAEREKKP